MTYSLRAHPLYSVFTILSRCCSPNTNDDDDDDVVGFRRHVVGIRGGY